MVELDSIDKILAFAIENEEHAAKFYSNLAKRMDREPMKKAFREFAKEEKGHKAKLLSIKKGKPWRPSEKKVMDLKIAEHVEDVDLSGDLDYQQALILAMKAEKAAFRLYSDLASVARDPALKQTLLALAQEEAKHKLRFEVEYDDNFLREN